MALYKNVASQKVAVFAYDSTDGSAKTGDAANITAQISLDGAATAATNDVNPTELDATDAKGIYLFDATQAETNADLIVLSAVSATADILLDPVIIYTTPGDSTAIAADMIEISGDSTSADNLELMYDGTGYTGDSAPASRSQVDSIGAAAGGSVNIEATEDNTGGAIDPSSAAFVGSVQSGTFASTEAEDGTLHDIDDTTNDIDIVYGFDVAGSRVGTEAVFTGFCQGNSDEIKIKAYDHVGADWEIIGTLDGQAGTTNVSLNLPLLLKHTGTGAELGKVYIRFETDSTTPSNLSVDKLLVSAVSNSLSVGYADGAIWYDDTASNTSSEAYVDGVADNPVSTWAAVKSLVTSVGIKRVRIAAGSSVTLDANTDSYVLIGSRWNLALGGQSIDGLFVDGAIVTGIGEATGTEPRFTNCSIGAATIPPATLQNCGIGNASGTFTAAVDAGEYLFEDCFSEVPGSGSPTFNFAPVTGASGINNRRWSGGATYTLDSNCTLSHEVIAGGGTTITTGGGDAEVRGICRALTFTLSAAETVQFAGIVGPITLSGTTTATVNLYGVSAGVTDTTSAATVTDETVVRTQRVKKNTALAAFPFKMVDDTDHITAETGKTVTATRSLDGAAFGACANSATEVSNGWYEIDLAAADTNADTVVYRFTATGADDTEIVVITQE